MSEVHDLSLIIKKKLISTSHQHKNNLKPTLKDDSTVSVHELKSVSLSGSTTSPMMLRHRSADRASFSRRFGSRNSFGSVFQLRNSGAGLQQGAGLPPRCNKNVISSESLLIRRGETDVPDRSGSSRPAGSTSTVRSGSARLSQQSGFSGQSLVLLDVVLLEPHRDPLSHLQILLQARLRTAGLLRFHLPVGEIFDAVHEAVLRHLVVRPQKLLKLFDLIGLRHLNRHRSL